MVRYLRHSHFDASIVTTSFRDEMVAGAFGARVNTKLNERDLQLNSIKVINSTLVHLELGLLNATQQRVMRALSHRM